MEQITQHYECEFSRMIMNLNMYDVQVLQTIETSVVQLNGHDGSYSPIFRKKTIVENLPGEYWIEPFQANNQSRIRLIAYGLSSGDINFYQNPLFQSELGETTIIQNLHSPVSINPADISGDGLSDIVICFRYGNTFLDSDPEGGKIVWLENPGQSIDKKLWKMHYFGKSAAMHRLYVDHFTQTKHWEIIGFPFIGMPHDLLSTVPVLLCQQSDNIFNTTEWSCKIINQDFFHAIHDATLFNDDQLDNRLIASYEGIS
ncbi:unnamed protein product [Rotaria magnacalcarata]|uniref:Aldos-2-ulose dehydratase beta-propeller domain-containing protein n=1 Tax=Rotaria magnacalcarata TaxID=392030 RepID=A0A819HTJ5_9BILA|nr:unnamed protein product [Rotaria magnacalcarata]CAF3905095.1 unnamed protein product [Rotaria magnacalcarata]